MRPREQRDERPEPGAQAEERVPFQPGFLLIAQLVVRPAEMADDPQDDRDGEEIEEEPLAPRPVAAAPPHRDGHERGGKDERRVAEHGQRERPAGQPPADERVHQDEGETVGEVPRAGTFDQGAPFMMRASTVA